MLKKGKKSPNFGYKNFFNDIPVSEIGEATQRHVIKMLILDIIMLLQITRIAVIEALSKISFIFVIPAHKSYCTCLYQRQEVHST